MSWLALSPRSGGRQGVGSLALAEWVSGRGSFATHLGRRQPSSGIPRV